MTGSSIAPVPFEFSHDDQKPCLVPLAHDRILEAHFFWHQSANAYHDPDLFRYQFSALLGGLVGTRNMLLKDLEDDADRLAWVKEAIDVARDLSPALTWAIDLRNTLVHEARLLQQSQVSFGAFRWFGIPKMVLGTIANPFISTQQIAKNLLEQTDGEDDSLDIAALIPDEDQYFGLTREWVLPINGAPAELLEASREGLQWLRGIVAHIHEHGPEGTVKPHALACEENLIRYQHVPLALHERKEGE